MRKWLGSRVTVCLLAGLLVFQAKGQPQPQSQRTGGVRVYNDIKPLNEKGELNDRRVFVTLYKEGQMVRSTELNNSNHHYEIWSELPVGAYEVHFEAKGYGTVIKRIAVAPDVAARAVVEAMGKNDEVWGAGPTLFDLQKRIEALEAKAKA